MRGWLVVLVDEVEVHIQIGDREARTIVFEESRERVACDAAQAKLDAVAGLLQRTRACREDHQLATTYVDVEYMPIDNTSQVPACLRCRAELDGESRSASPRQKLGYHHGRARPIASYPTLELTREHGICEQRWPRSREQQRIAICEH